MATKKLEPVARPDNKRIRWDSKKEERVFTSRTWVAYRDMGDRLGKLPFTLEKLRKHLHPHLGRECPFCGVVLKGKVFSIDHADPVSRGGSLALSNLRMVCKPCNRCKSDLNWLEYIRLLKFLEQLGPHARTSVLRRLKSTPFWLQRRS